MVLFFLLINDVRMQPSRLQSVQRVDRASRQRSNRKESPALFSIDVYSFERRCHRVHATTTQLLDRQ